ncbi:MAG TPA: NYN domain-containing protein [Kofleriaceae bacterium]|jgi:uncharacterized LabA/DUF88 family protein|nr:NYN domain-containing protein [Kofleriaceae bacterium]
MVRNAHRNYKVLALVDESNLLGIARTFNRRLDWLKIREYLADPNEGREQMEFVIYVGLPPSMPAYQEKRDKKLNFVYWLRTNGFFVVTKDGSPTEDGRYKANVDVLMAIDGVDLAVEMRPDIVILVTGDSDFAHLAEKLRRRGIRVEVAALDQNLGNALRASANSIINLRELFNQFKGLHGDVDRIGGENVMDE